MFRLAPLRGQSGKSSKVSALHDYKPKRSRKSAGGLPWGGNLPVEFLERRTMLSVSGTAIAGPFDIPGNRWTYLITTAQGETASYTQTVIGPTTFNGNAAIEVDQTFSSGAVNKNYLGTNAAGEYVSYGSDFTGVGIVASTHDVYQPYQVEFPATLQAGTPYMLSDVDIETTLDNNVITTTPESNTVTLVSDSTVSKTVAAGTYDTYQLTDDVAATTGTGSDGSTSTTGATSLTGFYAVGIGLIKGNDKAGNTYELSNFSGKSFHLTVTQPTKTLADEPISPAVQVSILDSAGARDTNDADAVTVTASLNASSIGGGTLGGTLTATTVGGVATFSGLSINKAGHYILDFKDSSGRTVSTTSFQISAGQLRFKRPVRNGVAGSAVSPAIEVELVNSKGKVITDADNIVTLNITGANAANPLTGNQITLVNGIATFNGVKFGKPDDYTIQASDDLGDVTAQSNTFTITGVHLAFRRRPADAGVNAPLRYTVVVEDARNRLVNTSSIGLGLSLETLSGGDNAVIAHPANTVDFGVADNGDRLAPASINTPGTYKLTFTVISQTSDTFDYTIAPLTSDPFKIVANHLAFSKQPIASIVNFALRYTVTVRDYRNHVVTNAADQLNFTLVPTTAGSSAVLASGTDTLLAGVANNAFNMLSINTPGTFKLVVVDVPPNPNEPVAQAVTSHPFKIRP